MLLINTSNKYFLESIKFLVQIENSDFFKIMILNQGVPGM